MFRISDNPDLSLKQPNMMQLGSGPSFPSMDSSAPPQITSVLSHELEKLIEDDKFKHQSIPIGNNHNEEDDYEVVMAEEVEDNLIFSNRVADLQENNELDEATMSYNEESGNYTASLQERSEKKNRKHKLLPKELYSKKNEPSNQK